VQHSQNQNILMVRINRMDARKTERGSTLVELMVIVGLLLILGFLSTYFDTGSWLANYRLRGAARDLSMNMQKIRLNAIKSNKAWAIVFDTSRNCYYICSDPCYDNKWSSINDNIIEQTIMLSGYKSGIAYGNGSASRNVSGDGAIPSDSVSFNANVLVFNSNGAASGSGYCYISNDHNEVYAVGALASGAIRLRKWDGAVWQQ
jgi:Tfp pilus assembly protein FimT